ncbi:hypothetical protein TRFO_34590 [Tritrichomonas foetus]|uniref:Uncharacterized protein n=1 Tax=Tritrichomonas foetus TaxID=1144522 RepID=A0A1J4JIW4_9EUKA|nr:hypothetical protein TRFO_34590 [Tritrichomonas foetus]|eukprot:OHS99094.1 hypothetical protein TRFO_34590 [Tritrichomonas foetus]
MNPSLTSALISNDFRLAQVLQMQKRYDKALEKYQSVCISLKNIFLENPKADIDFSFVPLSINKIVEIYREREDIRKAVDFMKVEKICLEYIQAGKKSQPTEEIITRIFKELDHAFSTPEAPKIDPQEIVKNYLEEKKKQEEQMVQENLEKLMNYPAEKERQKNKSLRKRIFSWIEDNPIFIISITIVLFLGCLAFFLVTALMGYNTKGRRGRNLHKNVNQQLNSPEMQKMKELSEILSKQTQFDDRFHPYNEHHNHEHHNHEHSHMHGHGHNKGHDHKHFRKDLNDLRMNHREL